MEDKPKKTMITRSMSKEAPLGEHFSNRIKGLDSVFDEEYDLTRGRAESKGSIGSPGTPRKKTHKKSAKK